MPGLFRAGIVLLALFGGLRPCASAQPDAARWEELNPGYLIDRFTVADGLPSNVIHTLIPAPDGSLWLCTERGLGRIAGDSISPRALDPNGPGRVHQVVFDGRGTPWLSHQGGVDPPRGGGLSTPRIPKEDVLGLCGTENSEVWLFRRQGLARLDGEAPRLIAYPAEDGGPAHRASLCAGSDGVLVWADGTQRLWRFDGSGIDLLTRFPNPSMGLASCLAFDGLGNLWTACTDGNLYCWSPQGGWSSLGRLDVGCLRPVPGGPLLAGTSHGKVLEIRPGGGPRELLSLEGWDIKDLWKDRAGRLWISIAGGGLLRAVDRCGRSLESPLAVRSVAKGAHGSILVGTKGSGVLEESGGHLGPVASLQGEARQIAQERYAGQVFDREGVLWVGGEDGLSRLAGARPVKAWKPDVGDAVSQVTSSSGGGVWMGSNLRFLAEFGPEGRLRGKLHRSPAILNQLLEQKNILWIATEHGLYFLQDGEIRPSPQDIALDCPVRSLATDRRGRLWAALSGKGLLVHGPADPPPLLPAIGGADVTQASALLVDSEGDLWIGTPKGLLRVRGDALDSAVAGGAEECRIEVFDRMRGLPLPRRAVYSAARQLDAFTLAFGHQSGLLVFDRRIAPHPSDRPQGRIYWVDHSRENRPLLVARGTSGLGSMAVSLPPLTRSVELEFECTSVEQAQNMALRYRISSMGPGWLYGATALVTGLRPGAHRIDLEVRDSSSAWWPADQMILNIPAVWWQTTAFRVALVLAGVGMVVLALYFQARIRLRILQAVMRERERVARDVHDDLGNRLSEIQLLMHRAAAGPAPDPGGQARRVSDLVASAVESLNRLIWMLETSSQTWRKLLKELRSGSQRYLDTAHVRFEFKAELDAETLEEGVAPSISNGVLLVARELLHNAVRHARPTTVSMALARTGGFVRLTVASDGEKLHAEQALHKGRGLYRMQKRARSLGGDLYLGARPQGGEAAVTFPIRRKA